MKLVGKEKAAYEKLKELGVFDIKGKLFINGILVKPMDWDGLAFPKGIKKMTIRGVAVAPRFIPMMIRNLHIELAGGSEVRIYTKGY